MARDEDASLGLWRARHFRSAQYTTAGTGEHREVGVSPSNMLSPKTELIGFHRVPSHYFVPSVPEEA